MRSVAAPQTGEGPDADISDACRHYNRMVGRGVEGAVCRPFPTVEGVVRIGTGPPQRDG